MGEIVNLNKTRKRAAKTAAEKQAAENRAVHGRTRAEREAETRRKAMADKLLDGARKE